MDLGFLHPVDRLSAPALIVRSVIVFFALVALFRLMGKQEVGRLAPFAFAVAITIGTVAAEPLTGGQVPVAVALASMATMTAVWVLFAELAIRSNYLKDLLGAEPVILVAGGRVIRENLRRAHLSLDNLLSDLRIKGISDMNDVEFAIMEPPGRLSVIKKSQARPATPQDLGLATPYRGLPAVLVHDGVVLSRNLKALGLSERWLQDQLAAQGAANPEQVFLALLDTTGALYVQKR
ncbi:MAG: DUF421 domain-containing protein [Acetobacteraceae bacterium]|nr:DUF421 domain-containing protein [Acetobacteraceae bacterium]